MRLLGDMMQWSTQHMPRWHPVSISGYHIREAGATAAQELAFTLKDGFTYVEEQMARGMDVDSFAPRLSFFFNAQIDFFEEIAKYRAARRIWARELRDTYGAKNPRSWLMRFHTQTAGVSLTAQQPLNNIVRTAIEALAGVLGGTQSLHTNSYDEALALPTEDAVRIALRTQQIIAHETGVTNTADPLGGSYFVEAMTDKIEEQAYAYFRKIDELGGMVEAVKRNYPQREIADAAFELQERIDDHEQVVVGVNRYTEGDDGETPILRIDPALERKQIDRVQAVRARRDGAEVERRLAELRNLAAGRGEPDADADRVRPRPRDRGRDGRRTPARLGLVHGVPSLLVPCRRPSRRGRFSAPPRPTGPRPGRRAAGVGLLGAEDAGAGSSALCGTLSGPMPDPLSFDPVAEARKNWAKHWGDDPVPSMSAVTSIMRVQQILLARLNDELKPFDLTFPRYEALMLLFYSRRGALPLGKMGDRLQVHRTSRHQHHRRPREVRVRHARTARARPSHHARRHNAKRPPDGGRGNTGPQCHALRHGPTATAGAGRDHEHARDPAFSRRRVSAGAWRVAPAG